MSGRYSTGGRMKGRTGQRGGHQSPGSRLSMRYTIPGRSTERNRWCCRAGGRPLGSTLPMRPAAQISCAGFSPLNKVAEISPEKALAALSVCFGQWGLPERIKVDNGLPFVNPHQRDMPTLLVLWLVGLGIRVKQNGPGRPQQNGTVEGLQGICSRWSAPGRHCSIEAFQNSVDEATRIQREVYRVPAKKHRTRLELYPELLKNPRGFDPKGFKWQRVKDFLADQVWTRSASGHCCSFFSKKIYVGKQYDKEQVTITYNPIDETFLVRSANGILIQTSDKEFVTEKHILDLAEGSRI